MGLDTASRVCLDAFLAYTRDAIADDRVRVEAVPRLESSRVDIRVSWYGCGAVTPAEAEAIADHILTASILACFCPLDGTEVLDSSVQMAKVL